MKRVALFVTLVTAFGIGCRKSDPPQPTRQPPPTESTVPAAAPTPTVAAPATSDPWAKPAPSRDPLRRPFLWSIEKDGKTTYLLGTIHKGVDAEARLPQIVFDKLDAAPTFAMETDLASADLQDMIQCAGCSLKRDLTPAQWDKLVSVVGEQTAEQIQAMQPMVAATTVSLGFMPETPAMDGVLQARAQRLHKKLVYLESAASAAKVLGKWMDVRALKMMLDDLEGGKAQMRDMLAAYVAGDEVKLLAINDDEKTKTLAAGYTAAEYEQQQVDMLYHRNEAWIPAIEALHADGGGFIAVGTLHLIGPRSVRELLEKRGYTITRITP